jgi:hypothetical protein
MPLPFDTWTLEQARKAAALGVNIKPLFDKAKKYYDGDHWQNADGWIGPKPLAGETGEAETLAQIQGGFVSRNVVKEVIDRHARGVVGFEPAWRFVPRRAMKVEDDPTKPEQTDIDAIEAALTEWWDSRKAHAVLKDAVASLLQATRAQLRLYIPKGRLAEDKQTVTTAEGGTSEVVARVVRVASSPESSQADGLKGVLALIYLDRPEPDHAAVYTDPDTNRDVGVLIYKPNEGAVDREEGQETAELTYLNENGQTVIRQVSADAAGAKSFSFDFGGRITMFEMQRDPLVSEQLLKNQAALNLALSMISRNVVSSGFLERVLLNAQMPGYWVDDSGQKVTDPAQRKRFVPLPYKAGSGTTNFITGFAYEDSKTGETKLTDPQVQYREPSPVSGSVEALKAHYENMLEEADQAHILISADATASGRSREQARADYVSSLSDTRDQLEACGRWLLETVLAEAEAFSGRPNVLSAQYRCEFTCQLNVGPIDNAARLADETSVEKGTISLETAMQRNGIVDVDAEISKINEQPGAMLNLLKRQFEVITAGTAAGLSLEAAAEIVGLDDAAVKIIKKDMAGAANADRTAPENGPAPLDPNAPPAPAPANGPPAPVAGA